MARMESPHFVLLPFLAPGHMNPMVDIAKLLAKRDVVVSILLTPQNAHRIKKVVDRWIASGSNIRIYYLSLPCIEAGLPEGCENLDMLTSMRDAVNFFTATAMLEEQVENFLLQLHPTCLIADACFPWTTNLALKLRIPRLMFHGTSCFGLVCMNLLRNPKIFEGVASDKEYFVLPDLPHRIEITKAQLRGTAHEMPPQWLQLNQQIADSEKDSVGTVANTFQELENEYVQQYSKAGGKKVWCIGPVSLCNEEYSDKAERGGAGAAGDDCLKWLDSHEPDSVIYACLGSLSRLSDAQVKELGLGLEASNRPFIWVIRNASEELRAWLVEQKFEERVGKKGLLIKGWAPQVLILTHPSVGGFITHCGWNSILEGVSAGLGMITWPVFAEQFCNEKFVVSVISTGVRVGVEVPVLLDYEENSEAVQVRSEDVKMAIDELMGGGEERRERARRFGEMAKMAVEEGGSSQRNMTHLIQEMVILKGKYGEQSENGPTLPEVAEI